MKRILGTCVAAIGCLAALATAASAETSMLQSFNFDKPEFVHPHELAKRRIVLQVSQDDPKIWELALNNAQNLMKYFGAENVQIVVVAYGPGLRMLFAQSPVAKRIQSLDHEGLEFDACNNTLEGMTKALGHRPELAPESVVVPSGVVRITQLETHGFSYIKP
jgi:hypothetical protein